MLLRRRDLLRLALGGALGALTGCPRRPASATADVDPPPLATLQGQDAALGHLLRTGELAGRRPDAERAVGVLIVGAGVAGLACAWRLAAGGYPLEQIQLVDAGRGPGGNAQSGRNAVSAYPWGAHYLRAPTRDHPSLLRFLEEAKIVQGRDRAGGIDWDTSAVCRAPLERLYQNGLWQAGLFPAGDPGGAAALARFEERVAALSERRGSDGRRAFALPLERSSQDPELLALDRGSFAAWLADEGLGDSPGLRWFLEYACRDDYGSLLETTSAWAGLHYFCSRREGDPSRDVILTWPEGNGRLVAELRRLAPAPLANQSVCVGLGAGDAGPEARVWHATEQRLVRYQAERIVFAGQRFVLAKLLGQPELAEGFRYSPWLVANVTLSRPPGGIGHPLSWDNVFLEQPSLGYVVANRDALTPRRHQRTQITWYRPYPAADDDAARRELLALEPAAITELVAGELLAAHPELRGQIEAIDAWRWGHGLIRPGPGFLWGPARRAAAADEGLPAGIVAANSDQSGLPLFEEAFYRGVKAGEAVLAAAGRAGDSYL